jgi:hypothetical protein
MEETMKSPWIRTTSRKRKASIGDPNYRYICDHGVLMKWSSVDAQKQYVIFIPHPKLINRHMSELQEFALFTPNCHAGIGQVVECDDAEHINLVWHDMDILGFSCKDVAMFNRMIREQRKVKRKEGNAKF